MLREVICRYMSQTSPNGFFPNHFRGWQSNNGPIKRSYLASSNKVRSVEELNQKCLQSSDGAVHKDFL